MLQGLELLLDGVGDVVLRQKFADAPLLPFGTGTVVAPDIENDGVVANAHFLQAIDELSNLSIGVLHETGNIVRDCPRLVLLLKQFSHGIAIQETLPAARRVYDPFAIGDEARFVHRFHYNDVRGAATIGDVAATHALIKRFDEIWQASAPAVSANRTGL